VINGRRAATVALTWGLLATSGVTLALLYSNLGDSGDDCDPYYPTEDLNRITNWLTLWGWLIAAIIAYVLFVIARPTADDNRSRYVIGAAVTLVLVWLVVVLRFPAIHGIHWKQSDAGLVMFFGPTLTAVSACALFLAVKYRRVGATRWRYLIAVPFGALTGATLLFAEVVPLVGGTTCH
jgi:hypothetical protein